MPAIETPCPEPSAFGGRLGQASAGAPQARSARALDESHVIQVTREVCFDDATQQSKAIHGWQMSYEQLGRGRYAGAARDVRFGGIQLFCESNNVAIAQHGTAWAGSYVFGVPAAMAPECGAINGMSWSADDVVAMRGAVGIDMHLPRAELMAVAVDCELLQEYAWLVERLDIRDWLKRGPQVLRVGPRQATNMVVRLKAALGASFDTAVSQDATSPALSHVQQFALDSVMPIMLQHQTLPRATMSSFGRHQVVKQAREYILEHIDAPILIVDLCRELRISRRMLQYSFQDVLGVNPVAYLRLLRLNGARSDLAFPSVTGLQVKDVVAKWGFWHLSRFSAEYRHMYEELPSDTLRRGVART